jgi:hypothetical protein
MAAAYGSRRPPSLPTPQSEVATATLHGTARARGLCKAMHASTYASARTRRLVGAVVLASVLAALGAPTALAAVPYIQLAPATVTQGQILTVYGRGFCGSPDCSDVSVTVGTTPVASSVAVHRNGRFRVAFPVLDAGYYMVRAVQITANRSEFVATVPILVGLGEAETSRLDEKRRKHSMHSSSMTAADATARIVKGPDSASQARVRMALRGNAKANHELVSGAWAVGASVALGAAGLLMALLLLLIGRRLRMRRRAIPR